MGFDPATGGRTPQVIPIKTWDLTLWPVIGPLLCKILGGGIGPRPKKDSKNTEEKPK